jgi:hypothetical protein
VSVRNETGAGLFVRCAGEVVGASCSDWIWFAPGDTHAVSTDAEGNGLYIDNSTVGEVPVSFSWQLVRPGGASAVVYANPADPLSPP